MVLFDKLPIPSEEVDFNFDELYNLLVEGNENEIIYYLKHYNENKDEINSENENEIRKDILEIKDQISELAKLLYVHDKALSILWDKNFNT